MVYVDGFVFSVPKKKLAAYRKIAQAASKVWMKYGALEYHECVGDDLNAPMGTPFPTLAKTKKNEVVCFSWITYKSRAHRDRTNAKVMKDPLMVEMCGKPMPFDMARMSMGGFKSIVDG